MYTPPMISFTKATQNSHLKRWLGRPGGVMLMALTGLALVACPDASECTDGTDCAAVDSHTQAPDSVAPDTGQGVRPSDVYQDTTSGLDGAAVDGTGLVDSCGADCADAPTKTVMTYSCTTQIGASAGHGFFALQAFKGHLYAGQYGLGMHAESMLYRYPEWELTSPGLTGIGESVCALREFEGKLYANTENSGDIFVSADGLSWDLSYDGPSETIGCGLAELNGELYAINYANAAKARGRVLRLDQGEWNIVYDSDKVPLYLREIVTYEGTLYAFGVREKEGNTPAQPAMLTSVDGATWTMTPLPNRYLRGHVSGGYLWLGSTDYSAPEGAVGIFRFDGTDFVQKHTSGHRYVTAIRALNGVLFAGTSNGWKQESGPSSLLMSADDGETWEAVCTFPETAIWDLAVYEGELYLGTWDYLSATEGGGRVIRVTASETQVETPPPVDCGLIGEANPTWKVCETDTYTCAGTYDDGAGCGAYCAAAGMICVAQFGGEAPCEKEPDKPFACDADNGHNSNWCECGIPNPPRDPTPRRGESCTPQAGTLTVGETKTVGVDAHTGDEATTQPKVDANDGLNGDNPEYRRHHVARAHNDYWYTSAFQDPGEPDPAGEQWVDYRPDFGALGIGCYKIVGRYRRTEHRADYLVDYKVKHTTAGEVVYQEIQAKGSDKMFDVHIGTYQLCENSFVRIQDPGAGSITFHPMKFTYLGPTCP